jgi:hypothetical protein
MRISGFNPNMSIEAFRDIATNIDTTPEQFEEAVNKALSENSAATLSEGLSETVAEKIHELAKARDKNIFSFVKTLNSLGDTKDELRETAAIYAVKKQARKEAQEAYYRIVNPDDHEKKVEEMGEKALKAFRNFTRAIECMRTPMDVLGSASEVVYMWGQPGKQEEILEQLKSVLREVFLFNQSEEELYLRLEEYLEKFPDGKELLKTHAETLKALVKEAKIEAEKTTKQYAIEKEQREIENVSVLLARLDSYQRAGKELLEDADYIKMKDEKKRVYKHLEQLASFCKLEELTSHKKITQESLSLLLHAKMG